MSNLNRHPVRRTAAGVLASTLAFSGAFAAGTPAFAATGFNLERLSGDNRFETSAAIAAEFGAADGAILASGEAGHLVDALSASFLAGVREDPVLLTSRGMLSAEVLAQLNTLTNKRVTIVGGVMAVSQAVETQLRSAGFTVTRIAGDDRYETSEEIIRAGVTEGDESRMGILVSGQSPVDALAVGPLAYKGEHPVFLTAGGTIPQDTLDAMQAAGTTSVIIVGGTTVVPESVRAQLTAAGISVETRLGGANRSETSRLVAEYLIANHNFRATTFNVASGANNAVDALSGAALSGKTNTVLLLTNTATDIGSVQQFATARAATLTETGRIFGGTAVVPTNVETAIETAGGAGTANQVTLTATSVAQGGTLTGTITGDNIQSVTVSGCGFTDATIGDDDNNTTAGRQFTLTVGATQTTGSCNLTFTITPTGGGAATTQVVAVNVTQGTQSATTRPELVGATIVSTTTTALASTDNPAGTVVRYTFDEALQSAGALAPRVAAFQLYTNAGVPVTTSTAARAVSGSSVDILFPTLDDAALAGAITLATVDVNAVTDQQGDTNPEGDAALGTAGGGQTALPAGITQGPDLVSIGGFRQTATAGVSAVDFVFDEAATFLDGATASDFELIGVDNEELAGTTISTSTTTAGGQNVAGGNGTTTITVLFDDPDRTASPVASRFARGTVDAGTVRETTDNESSANGTDANVMQAADISNGGNTIAPDLVSVELRPNADAEAADQALFTFDQPILRNATTGAVTGAGVGGFFLYETDGSVETGTTAVVNSVDPRQVLVTFDADATERVVGGFVTEEAVSSTTTPAVLNQQDEVGVANTSTEAGQTPGRTADPDLTGVALSQGTDQFNNPTGFRATYTFDEAVDATPVVGEFMLYLADGTQLIAQDCTTGTVLTGTGQNNDTVTCTSFRAAGAGSNATSATVGAAVLGTVDNGAVDALADGDDNPEGAEFTTGGTGTRTA